MMELMMLIAVIAVFWLLIHLRHGLAGSANTSPLLLRSLSLPSHTASRTALQRGRQFEINVPSPFILRGETTIFTDAHARLLELLGGSTSRSRKRSGKRWFWHNGDWGRTVRAFYDLGTVTAIVGQILGAGVLLWSLYHLGLHFLSGSTPNGDVAQNLLVKRGPIPVSPSLPPSNELLLKPLVSRR
jgi:hypothetical protein